MTYNYKKPPQVIHGEVIGKEILRVVKSHGHPLIQQYVDIHNTPPWMSITNIIVPH